MAPEKHEECEGIRQYKETAKEITVIRSCILTLTENSGVNKTSLKHITEAFKTLSESNSLTHYKLFARTEKLKIGLAKLETSHNSHIENDKQHNTDRKHNAIYIVSWVAIGVSIVTACVLAKQAGLF